MYDRIPAPGKANRVKITMDDGTVIEGVLSYADDATQEGSAYSRANVLPDDVCAQLAIDPQTSEPKDAFLAAAQRIRYENAYTEYGFFGQNLGMRGDQTDTFLLGELGDMVVGYVDGENVNSFYYDERLTYHNDLQIPHGDSISRKAKACIGEYLVFFTDATVGGANEYGVMFALNNMLTYQTITNTFVNSSYQSGYSGANNSNYAIFMYNISSYNAGLVCVNSALTISNFADYPYTNVYLSTGGTNGDEYALFAGGRASNGYGTTYAVACDTALTLHTLSGISVSAVYLASAYINGYCIFGGGNNRVSGDIDRHGYATAYSPTLVKTNVAILNQGGVADYANNKNGAVSAPEYAIFGVASPSFYPTAYNSSLTKSDFNTHGVSLAHCNLAILGPFILGSAAVLNGYSSVSSYTEIYTLELIIPENWSLLLDGTSTLYQAETAVVIGDETPINCMIYPAGMTYTGQIENQGG